MRLRNILLSLAVLFSVNVNASQENLDKKEKNKFEKKSCDEYLQSDVSGCNHCFDGKSVYEGKSNGISHRFNNTGKIDAVYYFDENKNVGSFKVLQNSTTWVTNTDLFSYESLPVYLGGTSGKKYFQFKPKTSTKYLKSKFNRGFTLKKVNSEITKSNLPAYRFDIKINFHYFDGEKLGEMKSYTDCTFFKPAWCGDGEPNTEYGNEECDPKDLQKRNWSIEGCSSLCKVK